MIFFTTKKVIFVGAFLAFALGTSADEVCHSKCGQQFKEKALDACNKGCDNFKAADHYDDLIGDHDQNDSLSLCQHSCEDTFVGAEDKQLKLVWCNQGCANANSKKEEVIKEAKTTTITKPKSLIDLLLGGDSDIFKGLEGKDDHRHGGLTISFGVPRMVFGDNIFQNDDEFGGPMDGGHMGGMFRRMNAQMNQMLSSMKTSMSSMMSKDPFQDMPTLGAGSSGGKMYIMESGPGYHEEKSYDIGPNGKMTLIDNDMIDRNNPLDEQNMDDNEVEVFQPENQKVWSQIDKEFAKMIEQNEGEESRQTNPNLLNIEPIFHTMDRKLVEGPRLPETGLRSRNLCYSHSEDMKWSDWASCLHLKLGVPRWLMTTSICMGIIFLLWLCLVIPSNAPKQRVKATATTPDVITSNPKEIEANAKKVESMAIVVSEQKENLSQDLPPAYDDVANLSVQLEPVHETKKKPEVA